MKDDSTICSQEKEKGLRSNPKQLHGGSNAGAGIKGSVWQLCEEQLTLPTTARSLLVKFPSSPPHPHTLLKLPATSKGPLPPRILEYILKDLWHPPPCLMPSDIIARTRVEQFSLTHLTVRIIVPSDFFCTLLNTFLNPNGKRHLPWENPVQQRETNVPKTGPHLHAAITPEPFNTTSSLKTRINFRKTGGARHPDEARGALSPLTGKLAGVGLHRKQKVNMSECLFIISPEWGFSNPLRLCFSAANSHEMLWFS